MNLPNWLSMALQVSGLLAIFIPVLLYFLNRGRKAANVGISKTEAEVYRTRAENILSELNINEIIEKKVKHEVDKFKEMLWDAQDTHYKVKLEIQERLIRALKDKKEMEQENEILKNELHEFREERGSLLQRIDTLEKEVAELQRKQ